MIETSYHKNSGSFGVLSPVYISVFGILSAIILGTIYAYAVFYIPFIYLNFLLTLGLGLVLGNIIGFAGKIGKARNKKLMLVSGIVVGLISLYVAWAAWILALSGHQALVLSPVILIQVLGEVGKEGVWSMFGYTPTGVVLYAIWLIEAGMIVWFTVVACKDFMGETPFCERCSCWAEEKFEIWPLSLPEDPEQVREQMEHGELDGLKALSPQPEGTAAYSSLTLRSCPSCEESRFLTFKLASTEVDSEGEATKNEVTVAENLILSSGQHRQLQEHWMSGAEAEPEPANEQALDGESPVEEQVDVDQ